MAQPEKAMTIMGSPGALKLPPIPWRIIAPHETQAQINHGQTLDRLRERGGLDATEAVAILEDRRWHRMNEIEAIKRLREIIVLQDRGC